MNNQVNIDHLCAHEDAYLLSPEIESLFLRAMRENYSFQLSKQPFLGYLCRQKNFSPEKINEIDDIFKIPLLFVSLMKICTFLSVDESEIALRLTSSGTKGQKTQVFFDKISLSRLEKLAYNCFKAIGCVSDNPAHCFLLSYERIDSNDIGTTWSQAHKRDLTPLKSENWAIEWDREKGEYAFDAEKWAKRLIELSDDGPVRLLGFPAFMCGLVEEVKKLKGGLHLHPESFIISGGGWKNHLGEPMERQDFINYMEKYLGLDPENIRDTFGMAEHGIPYLACRKGRFHVPVYSRVRVIDPLSERTLNLGDEGLLALYTPYNTAQPNQAILSTDIVRLGRDCECGIKGIYISSIRRGGTKKHKGCAIAALEILKKSGENK